METRHIKTFLAAASSENFRQVARDTGISQPAVSQQLRALEAELGVVLFRKSGRGVEITEAGKLLAEAARTVQHQLNEMTKIADMLRRNDLGRIAIGFSTSLMSEKRLPDVLRKFAEAHPSIELMVDPMRVTDAIDALVSRRIDIAVVRAPLPPLSPELGFSLFNRSALLLAVPIGHALVRGKKIEWAELSGHDILTMRDPEGVGLREVTERLLEQHGVAPSKMRLVADMTTLIGLVAAGVGVALLPEDIARSHRGVAALSIGASPCFIEAVVVTRRPIITATVQHLVARLERGR